MIEKVVEGDVAEGGVEGGETEFAFEGAATGGFDVDDAMGDVGVGVKRIGKLDSFWEKTGDTIAGFTVEVGEVGGDDF